MRIFVAALLLAMVGPSLAADIAVTDGDTFRLDRTIYRLDGIDAPEIDQTCLDQGGEVWPCGVAARDRLSAHVGNRAVRCDDKGPDPASKHRRIGICSIEGETATLNAWLVRGMQSGSSLPQRAVSRRRKLTHARTDANCGKDALQNHASLEDGISIVRDLLAAVVRPAMRTGYAPSCSASTAPCRRGARSRPSWRCGPSATMEFITYLLAGAIDG